jgi:UDP-glucose 4-epimerase
MPDRPTSLVTGGAGFIGSHVAEELLRRGHEVVVLDDLSGGFVENVPDGVTFVEGGINDVDLVDGVFRRHHPDYVYHLAAYAAEGLSHFIKRFNYENNVVGSMTLINAAVNSETVRCFVFTSSIAVYGAAQLPMQEDTIPAPEDSYGIAKYTVEQDLRATHEMFGLDYIIFRPHNVYGERQNMGDRYRNVIGIFMNQALRGEPFTIFGDGEQRRAFTYIGDIAPTIACCVDVPAARNQVFNVGGDVPTTVNELSRVVARAMGQELQVNHLAPRNEVVDAYSSHDKAARVFGLEHDFTTLDTGIASMADWARKQGPRDSSVFEGVEIKRNLPPSWAAVVKD